MSDGVSRSYLLYRGANIPPGTHPPLFLLLHGRFGTAAHAERSYHWNELADRLGFVVAYPDGVGSGWNAGDCCGPARQQNVNDVGFLSKLMDEVSAAEDINPNRIYAGGISNGAMMAYRLACDLPGRLAAIASIAGTMVTPCETPAPVSVLEIHGTGDSLVPYDGALRNSMRPIPEVMEFWRGVNICAPPASTVTGRVTVEKSACAGGKSVTLIRIERGDHVWPEQSKFALHRLLAALGLGAPDSEIDGSKAMSDFFLENRRTG